MRFISRVLSVRSLWGWIVLALVLAPFIARLDRFTADAGTLADSEAARVSAYIRTNFASGTAETALLVITGLRNRADGEAGRAELRVLLQPIITHSDVTTIASPATLLDTLLLGAEGHSAIALVGLKVGGVRNISALRAASASIVETTRAEHPQLAMRWTGQSAVLADVRTASASALRQAELIALPVTAAVALAAFGSMSLLAVAALATALVLTITLGANGLIASAIAPTVFTRPLVSMLGLALTIDYVLLLSRWPSGTNGRRPPAQTVRMAGLVVAAGLLGLAMAPVGELRAAALSGALVALLASLVASTIVKRPVTHQAADTVPTLSFNPRDGWLRWGAFVVRHPWKVLFTSATPLLMLVWAATTARLETPLTGWLPPHAESVQSLDVLRTMRRGALPGTARVLVNFPESTPVLSAAGWSALARINDAIRQIDGVGDVRALNTIGTRELLVAAHVFPQTVKDTYIGRSGHETVLDVLPRMDDDLQRTTVLVPALRALNAARISGIPGTTLRVTGLAAYVIDYEGILKRSLPWIVLITTVASFLALLGLLRAPVVALKAVLLNLLVAAAALGATVLVFQYGFGVGLLGHQQMGSIFPTVPVLAFSAAFGVSTDYELFLLSGVRARRELGVGHRQSVVEGLAIVGSTITRAALAMVGVFLAFSFSDMMPLAMVGFSLAVAVLLDATLVRLALAPATLALAGRWNWWPGPLAE